MSLGKLPVFKNLVSNSHSKRRFKSELTTDMISSPLGDFRHTMHVGRGGDVFGDTSFLSDHGGEKARESAKANPLVRALRNVRKPQMRSRNSSREMSPPPAVSPIIKNAVSLPHLLETKNGSVERFNFKSVMSSPDVMDGSYGLQSGFCTLPRWSRLDKPKENVTVGEPEQPAGTADMADFELPRTDSLLSFSLDLGPSLMAEVLGVMEKEPPGSGGQTASPVKFNLEGYFGQGDSKGPRQNGDAHPELAGVGSQPGVLRESPPPVGVTGPCQPKGGMDLHPEDVDGSRGAQNFTAERHSFRHFGGAISYPDSTEVGFKHRTGSQPLFTHREAAGGREGSPPTDSATYRILGRHYGSGQYRGTPGAQEMERRAPGSWGAHSPTSGQRVPADGEEVRGERYREDYRERCLSPAQEMAFSPVKTEAFAFADEEDEIRV
ncbi:uncharacterized protein LOC144509105 [Mustelus asterias]